MAKYYVVCGDLARIVEAQDPRAACRKALNMADGETISTHMFYVDERGYRFPISKDGYLSVDTDHIPEFMIPVSDIIPDLYHEQDDE